MRFDDLITEANRRAEQGCTHVLVPIELLQKIDIALDAGVLFASTPCPQDSGDRIPNPGCNCNVCIARKTLSDVGIYPPEELTPPYVSGVPL